MRNDPAFRALPRTVAITGATGLIGTALVQRLRARGDSVRRFVRSTRDPQPGDIVWDPARGTLDPRTLDGVDALVNLAGAPIAVRWSARRKREIRESRVRATDLIASAVAVLDAKPAVVLSGSAVGYYGDRGDELLDERSGSGNDFLAAVVRDWEEAARPMAVEGVRVVLLRTGIVLSAAGGALAKLLPPFRLGLGGPIGSGRQWMSWISLRDHVRATEFALDTPSLAGPVNLVAPEPVTSADFAHTLGRVLSRPAVMPIPAFVLELAFGEMARATLLAGQRLAPTALLDAGFAFHSATLEHALRAALDGPP
ncbi:MAG: TIGR01777 family oxidoreductase [bacterium]